MQQVAPQPIEGDAVGAGTGPDHDVRRRSLPVRPGQPAAPHDLPQPPLQTVALRDGVPVPGHDEGHPGSSGRRGSDEDLERPGHVPGPFTKDRPYLLRAPDPGRGGESLPSGLPAPHGGIARRQPLRRLRCRSWPTASRFRPFLRRRARIFLPALVFIRCRKPWRRRRFRSLALWLFAPISSTVGPGVVLVPLPRSSP